jgi:hypothetical protein
MGCRQHQDYHFLPSVVGCGAVVAPHLTVKHPLNRSAEQQQQKQQCERDNQQSPIASAANHTNARGQPSDSRSSEIMDAMLTAEVV